MPQVLWGAAEQAMEAFAQAQPEADGAAFLGREDFPVQQLLSRTLGTVYSVWYVPQAIRTSLAALLALNPKDEYPEARAMARHFVLHLGGTNTGKTYAGFQRLQQAATGVYLAPLRLLALEAQEVLLDAGVDCSLTTGEEEDCREGDTHVAATAEKLNLKQPYEVAVIDECQMIADRQRGYAWTRAILGVQAPEVHLCAAPEAKDLLVRLIESCGDSYEIVWHRRKTPLVCMDHTVDYTRVQPGDALITFFQGGGPQRGGGPAPGGEEGRHHLRRPALRHPAAADGGLPGRGDAVCGGHRCHRHGGSTSPIRRVIFMDTEKFDGWSAGSSAPRRSSRSPAGPGGMACMTRALWGPTQNLGAIRAGLEHRGAPAAAGGGRLLRPGAPGGV
mgnify:CR=1 FL=1